MGILSASMTTYHIMPGAMEASRGLKIPQIGIDSCKPPCECWEWNLGPLEKQPLLTIQPFLQPQGMEFLKYSQITEWFGQIWKPSDTDNSSHILASQFPNLLNSQYPLLPLSHTVSQTYSGDSDCRR